VAELKSLPGSRIGLPAAGVTETGIAAGVSTDRRVR